jgi:glycosidase
MPPLLYPSLYEIHTRVWLDELGRKLGRHATLDDVPDRVLDDFATLGFDWIWLLGVWRIGPLARAVARTAPGLQTEFRSQLPDFREQDVAGSPFAIADYTVHDDFGGDAALSRFRDRLRDRGLKLMLDFVPNHTGPDCPWVHEHPEYYIQGSPDDLAQWPHEFREVETAHGRRALALGRDPYFPGWTDTFQLNYRHARLRAAQLERLATIADRCDGVRCDMAMLILPEVIRDTWGERSLPADGTEPVDTPFWAEAIPLVKRRYPEFLFLAEVYWNLEWTLQQQGFDDTYDKTLYDRLRALDAPSVRGHLGAEMVYQRRLARFLENHDEPRAATVFPPAIHRASAVIAFLVPGLRLFYEGQLEGRKVRPSVQLRRRPDEPVDETLQAFHHRLLAVLRRPEPREGTWRLLECRPAWDDNPTWNWFIAFLWEHPSGSALLVAVNFGPSRGQTRVALPLDGLAGKTAHFVDLLGPAEYLREGDDVLSGGLFLDLPKWGHHVFQLTLS